MKYWKTVTALLIMPLAFYFNWTEFYFAIIFLIWSIQGIRTHTASFLDNIHKEENPFLFWVINMTWIILSILS